MMDAPPVGIEPTTNRLTGDCSTAELQGNIFTLRSISASWRIQGNVVLLRNCRIIANMYIKVKVITKAKKEIVKKIRNDYYEITIRERAERNMANDRVLEIVREMYPGAAVRMISGHHHPSKIFSVD